MNREQNSKLVTSFGDHFQLMYGIEVGHFAKRIEDKKLADFCQQFNISARHTGYTLSMTEKTLNGIYKIILRNFNKNLTVPVAFLDRTIFLDATEEDWRKISESMFFYLQNTWRKFMAKHIDEYRGYLNATLVLNQSNESSI